MSGGLPACEKGMDSSGRGKLEEHLERSKNISHIWGVLCLRCLCDVQVVMWSGHGEAHIGASGEKALGR